MACPDNERAELRCKECGATDLVLVRLEADYVSYELSSASDGSMIAVEVHSTPSSDTDDYVHCRSCGSDDACDAPDVDDWR